MLLLENGKWKTSHLLIIPRASSPNKKIFKFKKNYQKNTGSADCDSVKQILFGQRVLESYKRKLEDGWFQH